MKNESKIEEINVPDDGRTYRVNHMDIAILVGASVIIGLIIGIVFGMTFVKSIIA